MRVLLVDDEEDALHLLEILLRQIGDVEIVGRYVNPIQAIESLNASTVDAVFLDNEMPGMTGMEAARKIREIRRICRSCLPRRTQSMRWKRSTFKRRTIC